MNEGRVDYLACAIRIGDDVLARATRAEDGHLSWGRGFALDMSAVPDSGMFNGRCGEGWFLCALAHASGLDRFATAGRDALAPLGRRLRDRTATRKLLATIGAGVTGLGSVLYAFSQSSRYLDDPELEDAAISAAHALVDVDYADSGFAEFYWGVPALVLGALALPDVAPARAVVHAGVAWLLERRIVHEPSGLRLWLPRFGSVQAGFAHGTTGVAHALLCAHARFGMPDAYEAALAAFVFERALYRPATGTWPDVAEQDDANVATAWCHGGVGIGLSRLTVLPHLLGDDVVAVCGDIERLAAVLGSRRVGGPTNLCCGALGQIDFLLRATHMLDGDLAEGAHRLGARIVDHMMTRGYRSLATDEAVPDGPGLWQGLAGLGYAMLRLHDAGRFPSVLTFETT